MAVGDKYIFIGDKTVAIKSDTVGVGDKVVCMKYNQGLIKPPMPAVGDAIFLINTSSGKVVLKSEDDMCTDFWHSLKMYSHDNSKTVYANDPTWAQVTDISSTEKEVIFEDAPVSPHPWDDAVFRIEWLSSTETKITLVSRDSAYTHSYYYNGVLLWGSVTAQGTLNWAKTEPTHCGA